MFMVRNWTMFGPIAMQLELLIWGVSAGRSERCEKAAGRQ